MAAIKVCAVGDFTSKLASSYLGHMTPVDDDCDGDTIEVCFQRALESVDLPVTNNIISNLLMAIKEHHEEIEGERGVAPLLVSWGEYCACCIALYCHLHEATPTNAHPVETLCPKSLPPSLSYMYEVFLGGSCNPTTWRKNTAVPAFQKASITYYNPQVDEWSPELIEIEEQAKMSAKLQLFVVDDITRAISSMVEAAYLSGKGDELVCVVKDIPVGKEAAIGGDVLSSREIEDLNRGRLFTRNVVEEGGCLLATSLTSAINSCIKIIKDKTSVDLYRLTSKKLQNVPSSIGEQLHLLSRVFFMYSNSKNGRLTLSEAELGLRSLHIDAPKLHQLLALQDNTARSFHPSSVPMETKSHDLLKQYKDHGLLFDEFCSLYSELKYALLNSKRNSVHPISYYISAPLKWLSSWVWGAKSTITVSAPFVDVFLNGSCGATTWRNDISIPMLKQYGVSYFNPQVANWDRRLLPIEREAKERCSVLLYVITGETLSVASLVEAGYYIGKRRSVVLCISDITPSQGDTTTTVEGMELSQHGVKDYNRGRSYLTSMANKNRVPVYDSIGSATMTAIHLSLCLRGQKVKGHHPVTDIYPTSQSTGV